MKINKTITYRQELGNEFKTLWVYNEKEKKWTKYYNLWYYVSNELLRNVMFGDKIVNTHITPQGFSDIFWITRASVRNLTLRRKYVFLREWYYNTDKLIKFLTGNIYVKYEHK